jgi:protein-disulfide isomerase
MTTKSNRREQRAKAREKAALVQKLVFGTILVAVIAFAVAMIAYNNSSDEKPVADVALYENQPVIGDPNAPVKIVEFGDFKCPSCKFFTENFFPQIKKEFVDTGIASFYFVNFQFLAPDSLTAGIAAEAVYHQNKDAFWDYYKAIYQMQGDESTAWATPDFLVNLARNLNLKIDYEKLRQDIENKTYEKQVLDDNRLAAEYGVNSTPSLFVNGKKTEQIRDFDVIRQAVLDAQTAAAEKADAEKADAKK